MKTNLRPIKIMGQICLLALFLLVSISITSCEKETTAEEVPKNDLNLVGTWASTTEFPNKLYYKTTYQYKADGTGKHVITSSSLFESRTITDQNFKWSTKDNQKLLMEFPSGNNIENNYEINGNTITYTSDNNRKSIYTREQSQ